MRAILFTFVVLISHVPLAWCEPDIGEPTLAEARSAALRYARLDRPLNRWAARARWRNILPDITFQAGQMRQADNTVQFDEWLTRGDVGQLLYERARNNTQDRGRRRFDYEVRADIDLGGLLYDHDELAAAREERARHDARRELEEAVNDAWFKRLQALARLREAEPADRGQLALKVQHAEADLDALTGGWFVRSMNGAVDGGGR